MSMNYLRPYQILSISDSFSEKINFYMPPPYSGSLSALESVIMIKLLRCIEPRRIFEFGTYLGNTTRLLLENLPYADLDNANNKRIYTIDLPDLSGIEFEGDGKKLASISVDKVKRRYQESHGRHLVEQILCDSLKFNTTGYEKKFDFIFIDANHALEYVENDTCKAFEMRSERKSIIIWHDYGNKEYLDNTKYLDQLSVKMPLYDVEETMLVFSILDVKIPGRRFD